MNPEQQREAEILTRLEAKALDVATAAELLGVSTRQVRRLRVRFRQEGMAVVVHGNCGRPPANRTAPEVAARILAFAGPEGKYHDLNVCHMQELLAHVEQIVIGRSTLDRLLRAAGLRQPAAAARRNASAPAGPASGRRDVAANRRQPVRLRWKGAAPRPA